MSVPVISRDLFQASPCMGLSEEDEGWQRCCKPYPPSTEMVLVPQPVRSGSLL